jgi:hypothetical protein
MGMFDLYEPSNELRCPVDGRLLINWHGKEGPCALFVWRQGSPHPVAQMVDEEIRLGPVEWQNWSLLSEFTIQCFDCPDHQPVLAFCTAPQGVWMTTILLPIGS